MALNGIIHNLTINLDLTQHLGLFCGQVRETQRSNKYTQVILLWKVCLSWPLKTISVIL